MCLCAPPWVCLCTILSPVSLVERSPGAVTPSDLRVTYWPSCCRPGSDGFFHTTQLHTKNCQSHAKAFILCLTCRAENWLRTRLNMFATRVALLCSSKCDRHVHTHSRTVSTHWQAGLFNVWYAYTQSYKKDSNVL